MLVTLIESVYNFLWGDLLTLPLGGVTLNLSLMVILLFTAGIYFTLRTRLLPMRLFRDMLDAVCEKKQGKQGGLSSLQTLVVSTATRVGMGNLVGVVAAVSVGGAGAVFWMWVVALVGGASAFIESALAQVYKKRDADGSSYGGPSYYMEQALHQRWLGVVFAVVLILTYVVGFNMLAAYNLQDAFGGFSFYVKGRTPYIIGAILAVLFALCVLGGGKRLTNVTGVLVPVMGLLYIVMSLVVVFMNIRIFPNVIANIFRDAFNFKAAFSGFTGSCIMWGIKRGLYSNEAGMGSTPHAHALANVKNPHEQGTVAIIGVFIDMFVILTLNALVIISTLYAGDGPLAGCGAAALSSTFNKTNLAQCAFGTVFGYKAGSMFVAICLFFFAFSTILSWNLFGKINMVYLFGKKSANVYTLLALIFIFLGTTMSNDLVWELSDMLNQLMVIPNAIALLALTSHVVKHSHTPDRLSGRENG